MRKKRRSFLFWLSLLLYGLVLTCVLLYVRFPADKVERYLTEKISALNSGAVVEFGKCGYSFPLRLSCDRFFVGLRDTKEEIVAIQNMTVSPVASGFGFKYALAGDIAGGTYSAVAEISPLSKSVKLGNLELTNIDLSRLGLIQSTLQREVKGILDFRGSMVVSLAGAGLVAQEGKLTVREGHFVLRQQILLADRLQMRPLEVQVAYKKGVLQLRNGVVRGNQLDVGFAGEVKANGAMADWETALKGEITPAKEYVAANPQVQRVVKRLQRQFTGNSLPYIVSGSLGVPRFRFGSQ